ncbi:hypothetical protein EYC80_006752 [Monilinia laxa]|uniref:Uncharacterized protein n=1 Tax=Monilinia laxa TaxID=61186 RepID=A0A5N6JZ29_MONLA|nr:hypothetical protein EYC80_006752 [Monilinia laxa]
MKSKRLVKYLCTAIAATVVHGHNTMTFISNDNEDRILSFRCNPNSLEIDDIDLPGGAVYTHQFPESWQGNIMAKKPDSTVPVHRVVAEICFQPDQFTYYDISAIDNHTDNSGIHHMHPVNAPLSASVPRIKDQLVKASMGRRSGRSV